MAFVTFVFFQTYNLLNVRHDTRSVFSRATLDNHTAFLATGAVVIMLVAIVEMDALHGLFTTTDLTSAQWMVCAAGGSIIPWTGEPVKSVLRDAPAAGGDPPRAPTPGRVRRQGVPRRTPRDIGHMVGRVPAHHEP